MDAQVRLALSRSNLRDLPGDVLDELTVGASTVAVPAGSVTHWEGEHARFLGLVVSGVVQVFVTAPDGRTMTIRYCRPGALIEAASLFAKGYAMPAPTPGAGGRGAAEDVSDGGTSRGRARPTGRHGPARRGERTGPEFRLGDLRQCVRHGPPARDPASARPGVRALARTSFGAPAGIELVVKVSQRELAEAVGTAREVVVRVLRELRRDGVVEQDGTRS